ncbi:molybdenum ABC transporter ATP-binding protein [Maritimibacter sp. HL-12]|uniref:molybdenum ABC transporter ATP-binding protein n=1 Tax=Maritimibacter sp. HL-12 TaxID=1162418 RepID=UPI000A0F15A6|nr:molybdenum ABC transporter ATP-binding protein [Maritimibacter sp. HL-12]SMH56624.1 molybdate transport system ATP-binding protein [Maritimibacter sp. HL-12]
MSLEVMARARAPIPLAADFRVDPGELLALVGHSGSGKTTLLRTIAGLWRPQAARVRVDGETWLDTETGVDLPPHRRRVGVVFQNFALFPHMTAAQNVIAAMGREAKAPRIEAERLLELVNLAGLADRRPAALSGGQQQRVALARALARRPHALLLDEPFSAVDRATREKLHGEIVALRAHLNMPVVLVTHDVNEAQVLADRMVVIERGTVLSQGSTAEVMSDPAALRAMGLRELAAILPATVTEHTDDGLTRLEAASGPLLLPRIDAAPGTRLKVRIMAHEVILSRARPEGLSAQNIVPGQVARIVSGEGPAVIVHIAVGEDEILARITRRALTDLGLAPGDAVHAILKTMSVARDNVAPADWPDGGR